MNTTHARSTDTTSDVHVIPLAALHAHAANSNVMAEALLKKLMTHVERSGRYPPVIVRPLPTVDGDADQKDGQAFQILDGHHRVEALRRLEHTEVRCVVWDVDDDEATLLLATLNRLQGQDDPHKRSDLLANLRERFSVDRLVALLPEDRANFDALLALRDAPPTPRAPRPVSEVPVAVHFFLLPSHRAQVERALRKVGGTREEALLTLVEQFEEHAQSDSPCEVSS